MALLKRLERFLAQPAANPASAGLYSACVLQARRIEFYRDLSIQDTIDGRFDLLLLHVVLVMRGLGGAAAAKQSLFDLMFADMDRNLREMGVGDMSVGKRIRPMISAFYGRAKAYEKALAESDAELAATLQRNLFGAAERTEKNAERLASYVRRAVKTLEQLPPDTLLSGIVAFPDPLD